MQWLKQELEWMATTRRTIHGITVGLLPLDRTVTEDAQALAFEKIAASLDLIADCDPRRLLASQRLLRGIQIRAQHGPSYRPASNICVLSIDVVLDRSPGAIAGDIVHETTHARFTAAGIVSFDSPPLVTRMEARCVREQIAFARRLPDAIYTRKQIYIDFLESEFRKQWWTPDEQKRRYREWSNNREHLGMRKDYGAS